MTHWTKMNYRHAGWNNGYRYFAVWGSRQGLWSSGLGELKTWLQEQYGPGRIEIQGPLSREQAESRSYWHSWGLGRYPNPNWNIDTERRRLYLTEETLLWARLQGKAD